ncbi:MAG: AzlD domain-containing protein [Bauldia sp.]
MASAEAGDLGFAVAVFAMAAVTYFMRAGGFWIMAKIPLTPLLRRSLESLPGAVVTASILPIVAREGAAAMLAIAAAGVAMLATRRDYLAVIAGMIVAAFARAGGL